MPTETGRTVTFVLTGPREGFTGLLGGRYGFKNGELTINAEHKDVLKLVLCNNYACNIEGEAPIWETRDGAAVKVGEVTKPEAVITTIVGEPTASVQIPTPEAPKVEPPQLPAGPDTSKSESKADG